MKTILADIVIMIGITILLISVTIIAFYPMPEDYSYENFSPLEGKAIADQIIGQFNESAKLIIVQKGESYAYRYGGNGEWSWLYYYVNSSSDYNHNYSVVTLYQNYTTSIHFYEDDFYNHTGELNCPYSSNIGIENWTIDCDEALKIIRSNDEFAEFNRKSPGLNIVGP